MRPLVRAQRIYLLSHAAVVRSGRSECRLLDTQPSIRQSRLAWLSVPVPIRASHQHAQQRRLLVSLLAPRAKEPASTAAHFDFSTVLRAIGRAWGWRRRMEAGEFSTVRDLAIAENLAERHVSRQLRLAYLAPEVLKRLVFRREVSAVTMMQMSECSLLSWQEQAGMVFGKN